jgi:ribosomal subunit interface protein
MQLHIHADGLQLTAAITAAAEEKFGRLNRLLARFEKSDLLIDIELKRTTHHRNKGKIFRAEINVPLGRAQVFAASECEDLYEAMDHCVATAKRQLIKLKEKSI